MPQGGSKHSLRYRLTQDLERVKLWLYSGVILTLRTTRSPYNTITIQRSQRHGKLKSTKTNIVNTVYMPAPVKEALHIHSQTAKSSLWVFPNENTLQPYFESRPIVKTYLKPLLEHLNITYKTLYATRHSFASSVVENNMPITLAQKYLGHTKLSTTMDYYVKNGLMDVAKIDSGIDRLYA